MALVCLPRAHWYLLRALLRLSRALLPHRSASVSDLSTSVKSQPDDFLRTGEGGEEQVWMVAVEVVAPKEEEEEEG